MNKLLTAAAMAAALAFPAAASAVTLTATNGVTDGVATPGDRTDLDNAIDGVAETFFSLGDGGSLTLDVSPLFLGSPASIIEVTFGTINPRFPEAARLFFDMTPVVEIFNDGTATSLATGVTVLSLLGANSTSFEISFNANQIGGPFSALTILDITRATYAAVYDGRLTDGFDVAEISVNVIPLPAPVLLLLASLGGLGFLSLRRKAEMA